MVVFRPSDCYTNTTFLYERVDTLEPVYDLWIERVNVILHYEFSVPMMVEGSSFEFVSRVPRHSRGFMVEVRSVYRTCVFLIFKFSKLSF